MAAEPHPLTRNGDPEAEAGWDTLRQLQPTFRKAVVMDAKVAAAFRGERSEFRGSLDTLLQVLRLALVTDAFLAQIAYRLKVSLQAKRVPILPAIANHIAIMTGQVCIADSAILDPGVLIPHGQVVVQGTAHVRGTAVLMPWTTLGLIGADVVGPRIGPGARIGTGAKVLGSVSVGANARVGANAVVLTDVEPNTTVVGMPAKKVED